ncbi:hypothetical protein ACFX19_042177 [Malus domestica]
MAFLLKSMSSVSQWLLQESMGLSCPTGDARWNHNHARQEWRLSVDSHIVANILCMHPQLSPAPNTKAGATSAATRNLEEDSRKMDIAVCPTGFPLHLPNNLSLKYSWGSFILKILSQSLPKSQQLLQKGHGMLLLPDGAIILPEGHDIFPTFDLANMKCSCHRCGSSIGTTSSADQTMIEKFSKLKR